MTDRRQSTPTRLRVEWPSLIALALILGGLVACYALMRGTGVRAEALAGLGALGVTLMAALPAALRRVGVIVPLVLLVLLGAPGCGASALRSHATVATIASASLGAAAPLVAPSCDLALASCDGAEPCVTETVERCRVASAATEVLIASTSLYIDAIDAAALADEGLVMPSLIALVGALARGWGAAVSALASVGVTLPGLPPIVTSLLAGAGGAS